MHQTKSQDNDLSWDGVIKNQVRILAGALKVKMAEFKVGDRVHWSVKIGETVPRWNKTSIYRDYGPRVHGTIERIMRTRAEVKSKQGNTWHVPMDALTKEKDDGSIGETQASIQRSDSDSG